MRSFFYFLRAMLTFYFPPCHVSEKKEGGEVSHSQGGDSYE